MNNVLVFLDLADDVSSKTFNELNCSGLLA